MGWRGSTLQTTRNGNGWCHPRQLRPDQNASHGILAPSEKTKRRLSSRHFSTILSSNQDWSSIARFVFLPHHPVSIDPLEFPHPSWLGLLGFPISPHQLIVGRQSLNAMLCSIERTIQRPQSAQLSRGDSLSCCFPSGPFREVVLVKQPPWRLARYGLIRQVTERRHFKDE